MFTALGYNGSIAAAQEWFLSMSPIIILIAGVALALTLAGFGLALFGVRSRSDSSAPSGLDKSIR